MDMQEKIARYQEIERRGLLGSLPQEKQDLWAEIKRRGLDKEPDPYSAMDKVKYTLRAGAEGATFGLGDVVAGGTNMIMTPLAQITTALSDDKPIDWSVFNPVKNFKEGRADFVREQDAFKERHAALNTIGELGGGLLSLGLGGGGAALKGGAAAVKGAASGGGKLMSSLAKGAKEGAKWGAAYGAGSGLTQDAEELSPMQMLFGAAEGGAAGALGGGAFAAGNMAVNATTKLGRKAWAAYKNKDYKALSKAAGQENINKTIMAREALLDSADEEVMRLAEGAKLNDPQAQQIFRDYGEKRQSQQRQILENAIDDHFGNQGFSQRMEKMDLARREDSGPLYQKAIYGDTGSGVFLDNIRLNLDEMDYIQQVYKTKGFKNAVRGKPYNHMRVLDYAKQLMDSDIAKAVKYEDGNKVANLTAMKNEFLAKIDAQNPTYKEARDIFAKYERFKDAMQAGKKINSGSSSERQFEIDGMSKDELQYYIYGAREKLLENFNTFKSGKGNLSKKVFDQNTMHRLKKLPIKDFDKLKRVAEKESLASENINRLLGGSQTAERVQSMGKTVLSPKRTVKRWVEDKIDQLVYPNQKEIARMMTDPMYLAQMRRAAMKRDLDVARQVGKEHFKILRAGGPLVRKGEKPANISSRSWDHIKKSPDWKSHDAIQYIRDVHNTGRSRLNVPNNKTRNDSFASWDYYKKIVQTPDGPKEILVTVGKRPEGRLLWNVNPDVEEFLQKHPNKRKELSLFAGRMKPSIKESSTNAYPNRHSDKLNNSIFQNWTPVKPFSLGDFGNMLVSPQAGGLGAAMSNQRPFSIVEFMKYLMQPHFYMPKHHQNKKNKTENK